MPYVSLGNLFSGFQDKPNVVQQNRPQILGYQGALEQAKAALDPSYQKMLNTTLANIDRQSMQRGFYGQLPTDVFKRSTAGDLSMQHQSNMANYAQNLQQQSFQNRMAYDQFEWQKQQAEQNQKNQLWGALGTAAGLFLGGPAGGALGNAVGNWVSSW